MAYEERDFIHETAYAADIPGTQATTDPGHFTNPNDAVVGELAPVATYNAPTAADFAATAGAALTLNDSPPTDLAQVESPQSATTTHQQRVKAIAKPDRPITKNAEGKFICTYSGCTDDIKEYSRKCEWRYVIIPYQDMFA